MFSEYNIYCGSMRSEENLICWPLAVCLLICTKYLQNFAQAKMKVIFDVIFALLQHSQITHDKRIWFDNYLYCSYNGCGPYIVIYIHYSRNFSLSRQIMHSIYESFYSSNSLLLFSCLHMEDFSLYYHLLKNLS